MPFRTVPLTPGNGFFLTLEGIEGVGKSTCLKYLAKYLEKQQIPVLITREPGGTPLAEKIRELVLSGHTEPVLPETELLLLFAARAQHVSQVILPALKDNYWVICDRFTDASYAYQGGGRGMPEQRIAALEKWLLGAFRPQLTLILDAPVQVALKRTHRRRQRDRIESEREHFFRKVRRSYLELAKNDGKRYQIINAAKPLPKVKQQLQQIINPFIDIFLRNHEPVSSKK